MIYFLTNLVKVLLCKCPVREVRRKEEKKEEKGERGKETAAQVQRQLSALSP